MKILFLSAWFPYPPDNGSRIRIYNLIKALSAKHKIYLMSLMQEDSNPDNVAYLTDICEVVSLHKSRWFKPGTLKSFLGFFSSRPRSCVDTFDPKIKSAVEDAIVQISPNIVIAATTGIVEYIPDKLTVPSLLDEHNCEYSVLMRSAKSIQGRIKRLRYDLGWKKFARWEAKVCRRFSTITMVSDEDKRQILNAAPDLARVEVISNGVDIEHYQPASRNPRAYTLLYNGALTYGANLDAVRFYASEIYPILAHKVPSVKLRVTGRTEGVDLDGIADCPGIELTGYVDDIRTELNTAAACIVPLRIGGGSRLKILEAMAAGVPVISTTMGIEGINAVHGEHAMIVDAPSEIADAIEKVLKNPDIVLKLNQNARLLVEEQYSWQAIGEGFVSIVEQIAHDKHLAIAHD